MCLNYIDFILFRSPPEICENTDMKVANSGRTGLQWAHSAKLNVEEITNVSVANFKIFDYVEPCWSMTSPQFKVPISKIMRHGDYELPVFANFKIFDYVEPCWSMTSVAV